MKKIVFSECPYCKSNNLVLGFQQDRGAVFADVRGGVFGSQVEHIICKDCGSIIYSRVMKPEIFKELENTADLEISVEETIRDMEEADKNLGNAIPEGKAKEAPVAKPQIFTVNKDKKE